MVHKSTDSAASTAAEVVSGAAGRLVNGAVPQTSSPEPTETEHPLSESAAVPSDNAVKPATTEAGGEASSPPDGETEGVRTLVIGDSHTRNLDFTSRRGVTVISLSGACAENIEGLLEKSRAEMSTPVTDVSSVIVHIGTNDIAHHKDDADEVRLNLAQAVEKVKTCFSSANTIAISSILPRKGRSQSALRHNVLAREMNTYMMKLASKDASLSFLNNQTTFAPRDAVVKKLYNDNDAGGVHLSPEGVSALGQNFEAFHLGECSRKRKFVAATTPSSAEKDSKQTRPDSSSSDF